EGVERDEMLAVVDALLTLLETRGRSLSQHARRVSALALKLALTLGLSGNEAYLVGLGGLLHDLGQVALPDSALWQQAGPDKEILSARFQHPLIGAKILAPIATLQTVAAIVRCHHERPDGSGYPDGLRGEEIPLGARIVAVADAYDVLTSRHAPGSEHSSQEALSELEREAGARFDPRVVKALVRLIEAGTRRPASDVV